jgi:glycosyltransferase involved in cell wall biosynthesis
MRIGFVSPRYLPYKGGVETLVQAIAERLAAAGHQVEVLTLVDSAELPEIEVVNGVTVRRFKKWLPGDVFIVGLPLYFYLRAHWKDYDVVNAHSYHAMPLFWTGLVCPERLIASTHYHGKGHSRLANVLHPFYRPFGSWAVRRSQQVICASQFEQELVCTHFRVSQEKTVIVPDGIPLASLRTALPFELPGVTLLYVGRLEQYKRVDLAIAALACLPENYRLYVIGKGPEEQPLRQQTMDAGVSERVSFLKNVPDAELFRWYRSAQVLVMMSEAESFPMTSLEALAAGCRVVCNSNPPFTELAQRYPQDILAADNTSPQALASRIQSAAEIAGRANADLHDYSWDTVAQSTLKVFESVESLPEGN